MVQLVLIVLAAYIAQRLIRRYISTIVRKAVKAHKYRSRIIERQREQTLVGILGTATAVGVWIVAAVMILAVLEVNIAALATGAGLIGVIVGFGAQSSIKDFLAGIFIIAENQYRVGDIVELAGKAGVVEDITIRITRLRDLDGHVHIIPNGIIDTVTNMTFQYANFHLNITVALNTDIDKAKKVINQVGKKLADSDEFKDLVLEPIEFLRVDGLDDRGITIKILGKVSPMEQWAIAGEFRKRLKAAFDENSIEVPYPQRIVQMKTDPATVGK